MPNDLTPDECQRLHQTAERLAVQLRREAVQAFPGVVLRWLQRMVRALIRAAAAAVRRVFKGLCFRTPQIHSSTRTNPNSPKS
ncbi:MAG: hypothetical protein EON50_16535 [Acidovorax sp.]|nr:MAG: hypothetical protein EON50_16535 [Acidovorax sp.]